MADNFWTPERVIVLRHLAATEPKRSGQEIADRLGDGCTRNMAQAKLRRLGIELPLGYGGGPRPVRPRKPRASRAKLRPRPAFVVQPTTAAKAVIITPTEPKTLLELGPRGCRWPFGDAPPFMFCAADVVDGMSYCGPHCWASYARSS